MMGRLSHAGEDEVPQSLLLSLVEPLHFPELLEDLEVVDALGKALLHLNSLHEFATPDSPPGMIMLLAHPNSELRSVVCYTTLQCRGSPKGPSADALSASLCVDGLPGMVSLTYRPHLGGALSVSSCCRPLDTLYRRPLAGTSYVTPVWICHQE